MNRILNDSTEFREKYPSESALIDLSDKRVYFFDPALKVSKKNIMEYLSAPEKTLYIITDKGAGVVGVLPDLITIKITGEEDTKEILKYILLIELVSMLQKKYPSDISKMDIVIEMACDVNSSAIRNISEIVSTAINKMVSIRIDFNPINSNYVKISDDDISYILGYAADNMKTVPAKQLWETILEECH